MGTVEFPKLVGEVVATALESGLAVTVGLEIPMSEPLDGVTFGPFWSRAPQFRDGRSSQAMASLVSELAVARSAGADLVTVALDGPWVAPGSPIPLDMLGVLDHPRDETMARRLLTVMDQRPAALTIVVADPRHTRIAVDDSGRRTVGSLLRPWFPDLVALVGRATGGSIWMLSAERESGAVVPLSDVDLPLGALWVAAPGADGHHGYVNVGRVTASLPLRTMES